MQARFLLGFLVTAALSWYYSPIVYEWACAEAPNFWFWLLGIPIVGYWVGQRPRSALWCGVVCGWIVPPLLSLPELQGIIWTVASYGGCGTGRRWAWMQLTALLFCLPAALGQLRCLLRKGTKSRLPE